MTEKLNPACARCSVRACSPAVKVGEAFSIEKAPNFCPMKLMPEVIEQSVTEYDKPEVREFARLASIQEFECYERLPTGRRTKNTRIDELIQFAQKCGYKRLGIAFCGGVSNEARLLTDVLENAGFEVVSVKCKVGATPKERIGIKAEEKIAGSEWFESMCSPIAQAEVLNKANVDLAIMLGLCIGHDTLFIKYCHVPLTVLAVKDRVTGHNPMAALYLSNSPYYGRLMQKGS